MVLAVVLALAACATAPSRAPRTAELPEAEPDPLAFLAGAFPTGAPVRASVITIQPAGVTSEVLACVEHENVAGFVPTDDVDFANLYLVRQTQAADPAGRSRYLSVELWRYRPTKGVKICHQWVIWQDDPAVPPNRATYAVLIEDFQNAVLDRRAWSIEPGVLDRLARFYDDAVGFFTVHPPQPEPPPSALDSALRDGSGGTPGTDGSG
jgi:hypothetical protein